MVNRVATNVSNPIFSSDSEESGKVARERDVARRRRVFQPQVGSHQLNCYSFYEISIKTEGFGESSPELKAASRSPTARSHTIAQMEKILFATRWLPGGGQYQRVVAVHDVSKAAAFRCVPDVANVMNSRPEIVGRGSAIDSALFAIRVEWSTADVAENCIKGLFWFKR